MTRADLLATIAGASVTAAAVWLLLRPLSSGPSAPRPHGHEVAPSAVLSTGRTLNPLRPVPCFPHDVDRAFGPNPVGPPERVTT